METAPLIIHMISTAGFISNTIALITIYRSPRLQSPFGFLCAVSAGGNIIILTMYSTWYSLPEWPLFEYKSFLSRYVGIIGVSIWSLGFRLHLLIAFNRMMALVFPLASYKYANMRTTMIILAVGIVLAIAQTAPLMFVEEAWFCYEPIHMVWIFAPTQWGQIYERYFNNLPSKVEFVMTVAMDSITLIHLELMKRKAANTCVFRETQFYFQQSAINQQSLAKYLEVKLFFQSVSQIFPFVFCFTLFEYVTPLLESDFGRFLSTTAVWHSVHALDGQMHSSLALSVLLLGLVDLSSACFASGVCVGGCAPPMPAPSCSGGCGAGYGCGQYGCYQMRARAASSRTLKVERPETSLEIEDTPEPPSPDEKFHACCAERNLPDSCMAKCSYSTYTRDSLQNMYFRMDSCPMQAAADIHFCAAQGRDHTSCCARNGVATTLAGEKCMTFCDQRPGNVTQLDLSYLACYDRFENMKACFWHDVAQHK